MYYPLYSTPKTPHFKLKSDNYAFVTAMRSVYDDCHCFDQAVFINLFSNKHDKSPFILSQADTHLRTSTAIMILFLYYLLFPL